ncbi:mediator of RNA polymerase II transcription subunit 15-like [Trichogramma pretiosum]|uniref:mediator of RNA polymerase II transcription subunit 15-like n=1 Tax=Trichogramma pretiosum TaxID=7493 RepID=UPI000C71C237|nr:mediator of RNA polymerase II transcription subunit 15-like [Trichogramma pretiosum]
MENNEADGLLQPEGANQVPAVNPVVPNDMLQLQNMVRKMQAHIALQDQQLRRQQELMAEQHQRRLAEEQQRQQAEEQQRQQGQQQRRQQVQQQQRQQGPQQRQNQEPAPQAAVGPLQQRDDDAASVSGVSNGTRRTRRGGQKKVYFNPYEKAIENLVRYQVG